MTKMRGGFQRRDSGLAVRTAAVRLSEKALKSEGEFEGYGSVFGVLDSYGEVVAKGAFEATLAAHRAAGTMPALLWQHDAAKPIGVWVSMEEDDRGLRVRGRLEMETQLGREAHALLKSGALNGLSIGFMPKRSEVDEASGVITLTEVDLWETSLVTFPANGASRVSGTRAQETISGLADWRSFERHLRDAGGYSREAATGMVAAAKRICDTEREAREAKAAFAASAQRLANLMKS